MEPRAAARKHRKADEGRKTQEEKKKKKKKPPEKYLKTLCSCSVAANPTPGERRWLRPGVPVQERPRGLHGATAGCGYL